MPSTRLSRPATDAARLLLKRSSENPAGFCIEVTGAGADCSVSGGVASFLELIEIGRLSGFGRVRASRHRRALVEQAILPPRPCSPAGELAAAADRRILPHPAAGSKSSEPGVEATPLRTVARCTRTARRSARPDRGAKHEHATASRRRRMPVMLAPRRHRSRSCSPSNRSATEPRPFGGCRRCTWVLGWRRRPGLAST